MPVRGVKRTAIAGLVAVAALVSAGHADAHAFLTRSEPAASAVVPTPPRAVRLFFSEPVHPAGVTGVFAAGRSVAAGRPYVPPGSPNEIVIPLRQGLAAGPYAVRWAEVDVQDGHLVSGAFVFAVRSGLPPGLAVSTGGGSNAPPLSAVVSRWLLLAGLLVAAGAAAFGFFVRRSDTLVLAAALALATVGAALSVVLEPGTTGTRFGRWTLIGACVAGAGTMLALGSRRLPQLRVPARVVALVLLGLPTATGHASAHGVSHAVSIPADLAHLMAAAVWVGGIVELAVAPRERRGELARRFSPVALAAVALLGASGIVRAFNELAAVDQLWTTGYGRALLVKTGVLGAVLVLGWLNRRRLALASVAAELVLLAVVVGAVAVLTNVRPGRDYRLAEAASAPASHTVVYAGQADDLAVGLAITPRGRKAVALRARVLGFNGPVRGLHVRFAVDGARAAGAPCGPGCYAATLPVAERPHVISARIPGKGDLRFIAPAQWPAAPGLELVRRSERAIAALHTLVVHSRLASDTRHEVTTVYRMVAPDRLAYHNVGGSDSIIIGNRRWDRQPGGHWVASPQVPALRQPAPFWPPNVADASVLRTARVGGRSVWVVSFVDPATPSWFTAWIDRSTYRTLRLDMVAVAHFMHDRDGPFNAPVSVEPPAASGR